MRCEDCNHLHDAEAEVRRWNGLGGRALCELCAEAREPDRGRAMGTPTTCIHCGAEIELRGWLGMVSELYWHAGLDNLDEDGDGNTHCTKGPADPSDRSRRYHEPKSSLPDLADLDAVDQWLRT